MFPFSYCSSPTAVSPLTVPPGHEAHPDLPCCQKPLPPIPPCPAGNFVQVSRPRGALSPPAECHPGRVASCSGPPADPTPCSSQGCPDLLIHKVCCSPRAVEKLSLQPESPEAPCDPRSGFVLSTLCLLNSSQLALPQQVRLHRYPPSGCPLLFSTLRKP